MRCSPAHRTFYVFLTSVVVSLASIQTPCFFFTHGPAYRSPANPHLTCFAFPSYVRAPTELTSLLFGQDTKATATTVAAGM